jgi:hypothetical protein
MASPPTFNIQQFQVLREYQNAAGGKRKAPRTFVREASCPTQQEGSTKEKL